jgi:hypothetical protein
LLKLRTLARDKKREKRRHGEQRKFVRQRENSAALGSANLATQKFDEQHQRIFCPDGLARKRGRMPDQYSVVSAHLKNMGLAEKWQVVEPVRGNTVRIENAEEQLDAYIELSPQDCMDLPEEAIRERIRLSLDKPNKRT